MSIFNLKCVLSNESYYALSNNITIIDLYCNDFVIKNCLFFFLCIIIDFNHKLCQSNELQIM